MSTAFFGATERKARVEHRCAESGCVRTGAIRPGTVYVVLSGVFEGSAWSEKLCTRCRRAHRRANERFGPFNEDDGPGIGDLLGYLQEARLHGETRKQRHAREAAYRAKRAELDAELDARAAERQRAKAAP